MSDRSPEEVTLRSAIIISIIVSFLVFGINWLIPKDEFGILFIFIPLGIFVIIYYGFRYTIRTFVYSRIKKIYKAINGFKTEERRSGIDILKETEEDVNAWTKSRLEEIDYLKQTDLFRKEFIGNLAHELKTPIFSIQGYILTLLEEGALDDPEHNVKFLKKAAKGVERMASLVEDLDSVAKIESGVYVPEYSVFNINVLIKEVLEALEQSAKKQNIKLLFKESEENYQVNADRKRIEQVLTNLISNSISYGNNGGKTSIKIRSGKKKITIRIKDNGIGMSDLNLKRIFERFYRVDQSRSRKHGGSGLGLAIVKHIIEAHDQQISVKSHEGIGSTFYFTLNIAS